MRKRQDSLKHRRSMMMNYGHIHNYNTFVGFAQGKRVYKCSFCSARTEQK